ncbi:hypothetical protein E2562_006692 [Oryza meyeriana var. granulata]|uniref:Uncharacterized protein n=1 Tax=Oryza meyeriana var. granulata TaxID=110450 RepID=A0A6G1EGB2_9ORYZ|nr:hypothetical protein E2562_006692 [Oryza meyeriana var. granulata]
MDLNTKKKSKRIWRWNRLHQQRGPSNISHNTANQHLNMVFLGINNTGNQHLTMVSLSIGNGSITSLFHLSMTGLFS